MGWYRVLVRGENFPIHMEETGKVALMGFFAMRWVEADSPDEVEQRALGALRAEAWLQAPEDGIDGSCARVFFEEIVPVEAPEERTGATLFPMDEADEC